MTEPQPLPLATKRFSFTDLGPRVFSGLILIAAALAATWKGGWVFLLFWLIAAVAILWEWLAMIGAQKRAGLFAVGVFILLCAARFSSRHAPDFVILALIFGAAFVAYLAEPRQRLWSASGVIYAALAFIPAWILRTSDPIVGSYAVFWLFAVVWGTDIMAYFGGRLIGGAKLWPQVSPSKTWAGFLCGISCGALAGMMVAPAPVHHGAILGLGLLTGALAQGGDLVESSMKRHFGVKDASHIIPGHGGVMDRLDGFIAAALFAVIVGSLRAGLAAPAIGLFR